MNAGLLVIGYGNELRRDDGVGPRVARIVASWKRPDVSAIACQQLTPELSEAIANAERVVFVDAGLVEHGKVCLQSLQPDGAHGQCDHRSDPRGSLAQAQSLFGRWPPAWLLTVPARDLGFGEELSPLAQQSLQSALERIRMLAAR